jgi:eukaryotic-like serine/threonine-protein kinase
MKDQKSDVPMGTRFGERGRYEIRERIGRGGMADVYKIADKELGDKVFAVKLLSVEDEAGASESRRREIAKLRSLFLEESLALSRVRDSNVVAIISNGRLPDEKQTPYLVMEYLSGSDLNVLLKKEKHLSIERAADIILGVCAGVHACHLAGVIHRDLKPANIFLDRTAKGEEVKVLDFSVAKVPASRDQTKTDFVIGTDDFMAPEQRDRKPASEFSDQYSLGALLYKCLTGDAPRGFFAKPREARPDIPIDLEAALLKAMNSKPGLRFANVHDFGRSLLPFATSTARAKWKHYYTTPPLPIRAAFTGPITPPSRLGIPELIPTKVELYDFKPHERTTSLGDDSVVLPTIVDASADAIPSNIELPLAADGPPTAETAPGTDVDAPRAEPISAVSRSGASTAGSHKIPANGRAEAASRVAAAGAWKGRTRVAFAAGLVLTIVAGGGLIRWRFHKAEPVPATAPAWTRTALAPTVSPASTPAPASVPALAPKLTPAPVAVSAPATQALMPPRNEASVAGASASAAPGEKPHRRKRAPAIKYDPDGFPILH